MIRPITILNSPSTYEKFPTFTSWAAHNITTMTKQCLRHINFLTLVKRFEKLWKKHKGSLGANDTHSLSKDKEKTLAYTNWLLKELHILDEDDSNSPKNFINRGFHICQGGTWGSVKVGGICPKIGQIVHCDTGCMYPGA